MAELGDVRGAIATATSSLKESERGLALSSIAWAQAHAGDFAGALTTASAISSADMRGSALANVAMQMVAAGKHDAARAVVEAIDKQPPWNRIEALKRLARAHQNAGDTARAVAILREAVEVAVREAQTTESEVARSLTSVLVSLARAQGRTGDRVGADSTFAAVRQRFGLDRDPERHGWAWSSYAAMQAEAGDFQAAMDAVLRFPPGNGRDHALQGLVSVQAQAQQFPQALDTALQIGGAETRAWALQSIATQRRSAGDLVGAEETLERISEAGLKAKSFMWAALGLQSVEQASTAKRWLERAMYLVSANNLEMKPEFFLWAATVQASAGDPWGALERAQRIEDEQMRAEALGNIAHIQTENGDWRIVLGWAEVERNPRCRAEIFLQIGRALFHLAEVMDKVSD
jgi:tetratricopeptide (TPR) repeat protein